MARRGNGEGNLYQRKDGLWVGRVSFGYAGGKRRRKVVYGKTRREAAERLTAVLRARQQGLPVATERLTVARTWNGGLGRCGRTCGLRRT